MDKKLPTSNITISLNELKKHSSKEDCWISYKRKVYDLTNWLPKNPGSAEAIALFCGTSSEFENAFNGQHKNSQDNRLIKEGTFKGDSA